ncbi:MAG: hypothetical protein ACRD6N_03550, partial [Pyrinomonadaceae bacterium]
PPGVPLRSTPGSMLPPASPAKESLSQLFDQSLLSLSVAGSNGCNQQGIDQPATAGGTDKSSNA